MKLINHLKYRKNRFITYYVLDFTPNERFHLWKNLFINSILSPRFKEIETKKKSNKLSTIVITLKHRTDRQEHITKELSKHNIDFQFFFGTDGEILNDSDLEYISKRSLANLSNGSIGCAISHQKVWEKIAELNDNSLYLILEDDIIVTHDFKLRIKQLLNELPENFDLIFLGGFNNRAREIDFYINAGLFKSYNPRRGLYGYIINPKSANKLKKLVSPVNLYYGGIDTRIGKLTRQKQLEVYQIFPSIIEIDYSFTSNIYNYSERKRKRIEKKQQVTKTHTP
jgi:GR25 family glycosyltransferase involved in LPS biosynthesis